MADNAHSAASQDGDIQSDCYRGWAERKRALPNALLHAAFFVISRQRPVLKTLTTVSSQKNLQARFQGERFNQTDLDLYALLLHLSRRQPFGATIRVSAKLIQDALERSTGGSDYAELESSLHRLADGYVEITFVNSKQKFAGHLIQNLSRCAGSKEYELTLPPETSRLFDKVNGGYTEIDWSVRKLLKGQMEKWLHAFYSTHADPFKLTVTFLRGLSGSDGARRTDFRTDLLSTLKELKNREIILNTKYDKLTDKVTVRPKISESQARHLQKKTLDKNERDFTGSQPKFL